MTKMEKEQSRVLVPVLISACAIPISMLFWIVNVVYSTFHPDSDNHFEEHLVISPWRWLAVVAVPTFMALWGFRKKSLDITGAIFGFFATKFRAHKKRKLEADYKEGGQRNWIQVLCNGGMATQLALLYLLDVGCGEHPVDFDKYYRSSWLSIGILGAFACCNGDTWASEIATVIGSSDPFLITTGKRVPRGTNGGVSWVGLLVSALGGLTVGLFYYFTVLYTVDSAVLQLAAPQWPVILAGCFGGLLGSVVDSILGATLQYSGINENGLVVERPGKRVRYICGRQILDNHSVNLLSSVIVAFTLPKLANLFWP